MKSRARFITLAVLVYSLVSGLIFGGMWLLGYYLRPDVPDWLEQVVAPLLILAATFVLGYLAGSKFSHR
jgi:hypothetical protein